MVLSERVQLLITENGLSVPEFAARVGISQSTVRSIINKDSNPRATTITAMCRAFNLPVDYFMYPSLKPSGCELLMQIYKHSSYNQKQLWKMLETFLKLTPEDQDKAIASAKADTGQSIAARLNSVFNVELEDW